MPCLDFQDSMLDYIVCILWFQITQWFFVLFLYQDNS
jgi:hypothetical protein